VPSVEPEPSPWWDRSPWEALRLAGAALIVLVMAAVAVASYIPGTGVASCRGQITATGAEVELCQPIGPSDVVGVGLVLLVALVLIWPEISELGIGGNYVKKRQRAIERQQAETAATVGHLVLAQPSPNLDAYVAELTRAAGERHDTHEVPSARGKRLLSSERVDGETQLLGLARELDRYIQLLESPNAERALRHPAYSRVFGQYNEERFLDALAEWQETFDEQLRSWAIVRNTLTHFPERLSDDEIRAGIALARDLLSAIKRLAQEKDEGQ
jgi:hypothetical protein